MALGYLITRFLTYVLRMPSLFFDTIVEPQTYVFASIMALVFTLIINQMTNRSLDKIDDWWEPQERRVAAPDSWRALYTLRSVVPLRSTKTLLRYIAATPRARLNRRLSAFELIYLCRRDKEVEALQVRKGERWDIYRSGVLWSEAKPHCVPYISNVPGKVTLRRRYNESTVL